MKAQLRKYYKRFFQTKALVLMYHRIAEPKSDVWDIAVSPANFEAQLQLLQESGTVVPLSELAEGAKNGKLRNNSIAISFDDGYADNYLVAKPLLEKYGLPATFFVPTDKLGQAREFWWDELEELILYAPVLPSSVDMQVGGQRVKATLEGEEGLNEGLTRKHKAWQAYKNPPTTLRSQLFYEFWQSLRPLPVAVQLQQLQEIREWAGVIKTVRSGFECISASQLKELADNKLFDIGAHTATHAALAYHAGSFQKQEIRQNMDQLEELTGRSIKLLAYPYGNYNDDTVKIAKELGLLAAFTTKGQVVTKKSNAYAMGRFHVTDINRDAFVRELKQWEVR